jgi:hypothetical protein
MPLFGPFYFITFLRGEPAESVKRLQTSWKHFLSADDDNRSFIESDVSAQFLGKSILLKGTVEKRFRKEEWAITFSLGHAPHIAGGILQQTSTQPTSFSRAEIRGIVDDGLADIVFESGEGENGVISGRAAALYLNAKLDQIGRVKGRFKEEGNVTAGRTFGRLLECLERQELGSQFLSFRSPDDNQPMARKMRELEECVLNYCSDAVESMLRSFDISMGKWRKLTRF